MVFAATKHVPIPTKDILSWIFDEPPYDQDEVMYIDAKDPSRSISLRQARTIIRKLAAGLQASGLSKGDCVCVHSFNDIYYSMLFLGIIAAGGVYTGTNPSYTKFELGHHIKTSKAKFLISEPEIFPNALEATRAIGMPESNIWIFDVVGGSSLPTGFRSWNNLMTHGEKDWQRFDDEKTCKETTAALLFSSGTTGPPKAAVLSHHNLIAQHTLVVGMNVKPYTPNRMLCLPMFHAACVPTAHTSVLKSGYRSLVMRRFDLEEFLSCIEKFEINEIGLVPPIAVALIMSPVTKQYSLKTVRAVSIGAAPLGRESQDRLKQLLPNGTPVTQVWGMTETSCIASMFYHPEDDVTGSVGRIVANCDVKIIDENGKDITGYDTRGELCIRGPIVVSGYLDNPKANAEAFDSEGYFRTGDIMYCDSKTKKFYVVDRAKELIKVRGFQVAPPEIESVLLSHPHIVDAAVIGVKLPSGVEAPRAYVVRRPGQVDQALDEKAVKKHCSERLARYKDLTGGVRFVDAIPKNASGKILKRVLREQVKAEQDADKSKL